MPAPPHPFPRLGIDLPDIAFGVQTTPWPLNYSWRGSAGLTFVSGTD
jgi:hypothetical protein